MKSNTDNVKIRQRLNHSQRKTVTEADRNGVALSQTETMTDRDRQKRSLKKSKRHADKQRWRMQSNGVKTDTNTYREIQKWSQTISDRD